MKTLLDKEDPILRRKSEPVLESEFGSPWLIELTETMISIMEEKGAVGVAASQIGISKQVIVFSTAYTKSRKPEYPIPDTALINPSYTILSDEIQIGYEGCLNCGDIMGEVPRAMEIEYTGFDVEGNPILKKASGLEARIVQHEVDHLKGILFLDNVQDKTTITTRSELQKKA